MLPPLAYFLLVPYCRPRPQFRQRPHFHRQPWSHQNSWFAGGRGPQNSWFRWRSWFRKCCDPTLCRGSAAARCTATCRRDPNARGPPDAGGRSTRAIRAARRCCARKTRGTGTTDGRLTAIDIGAAACCAVRATYWLGSGCSSQPGGHEQNQPDPARVHSLCNKFVAVVLYSTSSMVDSLNSGSRCASRWSNTFQ